MNHWAMLPAAKGLAAQDNWKEARPASLLHTASLRFVLADDVCVWQQVRCIGADNLARDKHFTMPALVPFAQELLARARRRGWRINLRPLADVRNLAWIPVAWFLLYHGLRIVAWLVAAMVSGAGEAATGSSDGSRDHQQRHHQHW